MAIFPNWPLETWPEYLSGWEPHHLLHGRRVPRRWRAPGIAGHDNSSITALHGSESCHSISLSSFATLLCAVAEIWATWPVLLATISLGHLAQATQVDSVCIYLLIDKLREPAECTCITNMKLNCKQNNRAAFMEQYNGQGTSAD